MPNSTEVKNGNHSSCEYKGYKGLYANYKIHVQ